MNKLNVIVIEPYGRAGSMLMQSLFDSHPEVISFPYVYDCISLEISSNIEDAIDTFIVKNRNLFSTKNSGFLSWGSSSAKRLGPNHDEDFEIDVLRFKKNCLELSGLYKINPNSKESLFNLVHIALAKTLDYDIDRLKYIFIHLHFFNLDTERMLDFLKLNYPNLYFLSLMRDFRETWLGWRQVVLRRNSNENMNLYLSKSAISWYSRYVNLYNRIINNEFKNVKIVDLNKLHSLENEGMKRICYFLNIEYCDIILNSTFGGKAWIGNASDEKNEKGLNKERAKYQWSLKLSSYDIEM